MTTESLKSALADARARYVAANPRSRSADRRAEQFMPGGNTRSVLHYEPYPLTMVRGEGAELVDLDGHRYADFLCEYSAGLFGHSDKIIRAAVHEAIDRGVVMGAPTHYERELAGLLCARFPSIDKIRFCNSGTEANLMAITTARTMTGRDKVIAFDGAYHGGVIKFPNGNSRHNVPYDFVLSKYNDTELTADLIRQLDNELAAIIVEPILGAGGNIPGTREFLEMLREESRKVGAILIFDEVKTGRIGPAGIQGLMDIQPDLTTLGKFIGGGLPTGAFGGSTEIMDHYNPKKPGTWNHAGTFNNNVCSMAAGAAGIGEIYTQQRARDFLKWSEAFRLSLNEMFADRDMPMYCNGLGSIFAIHFSRKPVERRRDISAGCLALRPLLHMELLLQGVLVAGRGDVFQSLPMTEKHLFKVSLALEEFIDRYRPLVSEVIGT
jgi:glutamate-1-semialdehyde 2,1-aminomutase